MNIALSLLSAAANSSEATAGVIDRLQSYTATESQTIAQQQIADPDYWGSVGIITLTGILVVFFILAILIFIFWLMGTIFQSIDKNKKNKAEAAKKAAAAAAPAPAPAAAPVVEEAVSEPDSDEEIMAVISAAVAAYAAEEGTAYTIRNVKRRDNRTRSAWSLAGIGENTRPF